MPRLALLIDAENISVLHHAAIAERARLLGDIVVARLFGDFTEIRLSGWLDVARAHGLQPVMQLSGGSGKNSSDIALAIDAMDILHDGAADAFCLVSDDRDFIPLATRLRAAGKRVYVVTTKKTDRRLQAVCSDVFSLAPPRAEVDPPIVSAFRAVAANGHGEMTLAQVATALRKHAPGLLPEAGGKGKVRKLLKASGHFIESGEGSGLRVRLKQG